MPCLMQNNNTNIMKPLIVQLRYGSYFIRFHECIENLLEQKLS